LAAEFVSSASFMGSNAYQNRWKLLLSKEIKIIITTAEGLKNQRILQKNNFNDGKPDFLRWKTAKIWF
jgi:hypothetical protein